eukprot:scaffold2187_cov180-Alexandrium_tamarense.AAC.8
MAKQHQKYEGVPVAEAAAVVFPVHTAVSDATTAFDDSSLPTATPVSNKHHNAEQEDGISVTWEKGELQPSEFRDKLFAVVFGLHLLALTSTAIVLTPAWLKEITDTASGSEEDEASDSSVNESSASPAFLATVFAIAIVAAPALSLFAMFVMQKNAKVLIKASLWASVTLCGFLAIICLVTVPPAGIVYGIITAFLFCYARRVEHKIPYAACNLRCGISVLTSNLGLVLIAFGVMIGLIGYTCLWAIAFGASMSKDEMWEDVQQVDEYSSDGKTLSAFGGTVAALFGLSFYWTHQALKNVVRVSVAGVTGTWWFSPSEAASFCSVAVRDSFFRSTTYSFGSICFGSLIVAVLHMIRSMLRSSANGNGNGGNVLRCIAVCILSYIEALVEYFNKWAFIYVGLYGYDYISAGKRVMSLFKTRGWDAIIADNLVNRLLGITSLTIGLLTGLCTLFVAFCFEENSAGMLGAGFLIGLVIGLVISGITFGLLSSAVDSIIVCYAEAPSEFNESHPVEAQDMHETWTSAWPSHNLNTLVVIGLGGGMGVV